MANQETTALGERLNRRAVNDFMLKYAIYFVFVILNDIEKQATRFIFHRSTPISEHFVNKHLFVLGLDMNFHDNGEHASLLLLCHNAT